MAQTPKIEIIEASEIMAAVARVEEVREQIDRSYERPAGAPRLGIPCPLCHRRSRAYGREVDPQTRAWRYRYSCGGCAWGFRL